MLIQDVSRQTVDVGSYHDRSKRIVITVNRGKPSEIQIVLDSPNARELVKELTENL
jgi:hypothetical protein